MNNISYIDEIYSPLISIGDDMEIKNRYLISNYGTVLNKENNRIIIPHENHNGYLQVSLCINNNRVFRKVHRLVMMTFYYFDGCEKYQVNHKDGNKLNNAYWNLEWCTPKENILHSINTGLRSSFLGNNNPKAILNENKVRKIVELLLNGYSDNYIIDNICDGNKSLFREIVYGHTWTYLISEDEMNKISLTRKGNIISIDDRNNLCKFYQDNKSNYNGYGSITKMINDAIKYYNLDNNESIFRIAKRLYYRYESPEITCKYTY